MGIAYDSYRRPTQLLENGSVNLAKYTYDTMNRRTQVDLGNGTRTEVTYDPQGWVSNLNHRFTSSTEDWLSTFTRNQLGDIKQAKVTNNRYGWMPGVSSSTYTTNALNQYTAASGKGVTYDANGNLKGDGEWTYGYDPDNRLKTASRSGTSATLAYDPEGRLVKTTINGTDTNLLYDGQNLVGEYDGTGKLVRRYVFGPGVDEPLVQYEGAVTTSKSWLYANQQGSVVALANASGATTASQSYGPFGETNGTPASRFGYTGQQYLAPLGLYYYKARMYSPTMGRFLQTDPVGYKDDLNWYAYVGNNPVNFSDPYGLTAQCSQSDTFGQGVAKSDAITPLYPEAAFIPAVKIAQTIYSAINTTAAPTATQTISTGRTTPNSLQEKLAMEEVMANPQGTTPARMPKMSDTKNGLTAEEGWVKRTQNVNGVEIHYVENVKTGKIVDFKFKD